MSNDVPFAEFVVIGDDAGAPTVAVRVADDGSVAGRAAGEPTATPVPRVAHRYGPNVAILIGGESDEPPSSSTDLSRVDLAALSPAERLGVEAATLRQSPQWLAAKRNRPRQGDEWDMRGQCRQDEPTAGRAAEAPAGAEGRNDHLEGAVAVGIVIVDGPTPALRFTAAERTKVIAEVQAGLSYLVGVSPSANVSFLYDIRTPSISVPADPNLPEDDLEAHWRAPALEAMGFASTGAYVDHIRQNLGTRWTYAAYFVKYPVQHFAYQTGDRVIMQYANDGWGPDNIDRVFAHETGHVFGAPDEYKDSNCTCGGAYGRFGEPNDNCENCGGSATCLMKKNDYQLCKHTYRHLGWRSPVQPGTAGWVTSVSSRDDRLDAFAVDSDGAIRWAFWEPGMAEWFQGWIDVLGGRAAPGSQVTAVARRPGQLDLFVVGTDGQVWTAARNPQGQWWGWAAIPGVTVPQRGYVHAVSRGKDLLDIFVTDTQGRVMSAGWSPANVNGAWQGWWHIRGGMAAPGAPVTAISRRKDQLDIFVTGTDGGVYTAGWHPTNQDGWHGWTRIGDVVMRPGGYVTPVSRNKDLLDIFATDSQGRVMSAGWSPANANAGWHGWWHILGGVAGNGSVVQAISRSTDQLDIFVIGTDKRIYTASWHPTHPNGAWHGWRDVNGGQAVVGAAITGVSRNKDLLDVFMPGLDGRPWSAGWSPANPNATWSGWWSVGP